MGQEQLEAPRFPPRFNAAQLAAVAFLVAVVAGWTAFVVVVRIGIEGYNPFYPAIDTRFAPGYGEAAFAAVQPGMTKVEVLQLLGPPLNAQRDQAWAYSEDGACPWWDFAWLARSVQFDAQGRVVETRAAVHYD